MLLLLMFNMVRFYGVISIHLVLALL